MTITWNSRPRKSYTIESGADLQLWSEVADGLQAEDGETTSLTVEGISAEAAEFYLRVREE